MFATTDDVLFSKFVSGLPPEEAPVMNAEKRKLFFSFFSNFAFCLDHPLLLVTLIHPL